MERDEFYSEMYKLQKEYYEKNNEIMALYTKLLAGSLTFIGVLMTLLKFWN